MINEKYKRPLLKISGEALAGQAQHGIDLAIAKNLADELVEISKLGIQISVVVGGGNIFRGFQGALDGIERSTADHMGMLAAVINALALSQIIKKNKRDARVMSAIPMVPICETYTIARALHHITQGRIVIFAAGTGNPFFTTDTAAVLRAIEMCSTIVIKATQVDGVYSSDPKKDKNAKRFDKLTYSEVLSNNLQVMDATAVALAREQKLPIMVCSLKEPGNLLKVIKGEAKSTFIGEDHLK